MLKMRLTADVMLRGSEHISVKAEPGSRWIEIAPDEDENNVLSLFFPTLNEEDCLLACENLIAAVEKIKASVRT